MKFTSQWEQRTQPQKPNASDTDKNVNKVLQYLKFAFSHLILIQFPLFAHLSVLVDVCNKNKMSLDNSGLRAVNIL